MPRIKSAKKNLRKSQRNYKRNLIVKNRLKTTLKGKDKVDLAQVYKIIDKAAKSGIISQNKANRLKSAAQKQFGAKEAVIKTAPKKTTVAKKTAKKPVKKSAAKRTKNK